MTTNDYFMLRLMLYRIYNMMRFSNPTARKYTKIHLYYIGGEM